MSGSRRGLAVGIGAVGLGAAWAAAQRADRRAIADDPRGEALFKPFGGREQSVPVSDDIELAVRIFGPEDAPTIVLVHGWTCSAEFWKLQVAALEADRRIVTFDLRGHGQSGRPANRDYSTESFASDLGAILGHCVPAGERTLVVGHSLGAMTIVAWAGENPDLVDERLSAAILVNTGVGDLITDSLVVGMPDGFDRLKRIAGETLLRARTPIPAFSTPISLRVIREFVVGPEASPAEAAFCERLVLACHPSVRGAVGGTLGRLDLRQSLASLTVPTLIVAGERDRLTPPKHAHAMAEQIPDVLDVFEIPGSGHMSPVEADGVVSSLIARLSGLEEPRRSASEPRRSASGVR